MSRCSVRRLLVLAGLIAVTAEAQTQPKYTQVYSSDSLDLQSPALSPDGRWVAFTARPAQTAAIHLQIIAASGGQPVTLTSGDYADTRPTWFPSGDRILFKSSRVGGALMSIRIDPASGRALGQPQRVTVDDVHPAAFAVSPDGKQIAYATGPRDGRVQLKTIPATGGTARVVLEEPKGPFVQLYWPTQGTLRYAVVDEPTMRFTVKTVSPTGGAAAVVATYDQAKTGFALIGPHYTIRGARVRIGGDTMGVASVVGVAGDTLARFETRATSSVGGLNQIIRPTLDPRVVMLASTQGREAIHALATDGGEPWDVRPTVEGRHMDADYPQGFTADSRNLYVHRRGQGGNALFITPLHGDPGRSIPLASDALWPHPTRDGRYVSVWGGHPRDTTRRAYLVDASTGHTEMISAAAMEVDIPAEAPFWGVIGDDTYYAERKGDRVEVRRWSPGKASTLVCSFAADGLTGSKGLVATTADGALCAYARSAGDSSRVFVQDAGGQPRPVLAVHGVVRSLAWSPKTRDLAVLVRGSDSSRVVYVATYDDATKSVRPPRAVWSGRASIIGPQWSPDGRTLFTAAQVHRGTDSVVVVNFIAVDRATPVHSVELPGIAAAWDDAVWLNDSQTMLVLTANKAGWRMQLWRVSMRDGQRPVNIASKETASFWEFIVSPDDKTVVYQVDLPARSTIWRVDLPSLKVPADAKR
jgi:Tol biopolymer transport system component